MRLLVVIAPEQFRDEELFEPISLFRTEGIEFEIASTRTGTARGMMGGRAEASLYLDDVRTERYDGIVIVGGIGAEKHLWGSGQLRDLIRRFDRDGKLLAAICLSPVALGRAGALKGKRATVFRTAGTLQEMSSCGALASSEDVVVDGRVITANGPAAARRFGEEIVKLLKKK
ncbi:MAG: DJ-1/PfpI family protein [Methanomicrobiales archaeon]|nr:DJ-1/PfpI family protein [Methanomicrobiales archaeon]